MATIKPPTKAQIEASNNYKREKEILRDIHKIDVAIQNADPAEMESLHRYLDGKYQYGIADWEKACMDTLMAMASNMSGLVLILLKITCLR